MIPTEIEEEIHAHAVMEMMIKGGKGYSLASLAAEIRQTFGENSRFYSCTAAGMDPEEVVEFLANKGKFSGPEDNFVFDTGQMCSGH